MKRRQFITSSAGTGLLIGSGVILSCETAQSTSASAAGYPLVLSTWNNIPANEKAWVTMQDGGSALDAVEAGVRVVEADPNDTSVGYGGLPDRNGIVTLDACIMDKDSNCGSVGFLQHILHPISVARKVMEETDHVMLVGEGALQFALEQGFEKENLLTEQSKQAWIKWQAENKSEVPVTEENHDTIGMLALDENGDIAGACTTSGRAYKLHGRIGDSPIIGAGLYVDNEVGGATATGVGEEVIRCVGSFLIVELMRQGASPQEACEEAISRIIKKSAQQFQIGFLAVNKAGEVGAHSVQKNFDYVLYQEGQNNLHSASFG